MQQFTLKLCQSGRAGLLGFSGLVAAFAVAAIVTRPLPPGDGSFVAFALVGTGGCYAAYRLVRRLAVREALVTVEAAQLTITYPATGRQVQLALADVVAYRDELLQNGRELRFRLRSGAKVKLATNSFLGATGDYDGLLQAVEAALAAHQAGPHAAGSAPAMREKSFYEKPWATLLLATAGLLVLTVFGHALLWGKALPGGAFTALGSLLSYAGLWYATRQRWRK